MHFSSSSTTGSRRELHPAVFVISWIFFSNLTILFNKWLLDTAGFPYPLILTTLHLGFATALTQLLARFTPLLFGAPSSSLPAPLLLSPSSLPPPASSLHDPSPSPSPSPSPALGAGPPRMTGRLYLRAILPIGLLYTLSLAFSNLAYLHLSVSFIQMLKAVAPVSTLAVGWAWGVTTTDNRPRAAVLANVLVIALGVLLSSLGEAAWSWPGFVFQMGGTVAESMRLLLIQVLLADDNHTNHTSGNNNNDNDDGGEGTNSRGGPGLKMDPLVGLYYYAPVCAVLNGLVALVAEAPRFRWADLEGVGVGVLVLNGLVAFMLNVSSVFLVGRTSALAMNLTGILKSILLVLASVAIWATPITPLQAFGYAVALAGMSYYSLGPDGVRAAAASLRGLLSLSWSDPAGGRFQPLPTDEEGGGVGNGKGAVDTDKNTAWGGVDVEAAAAAVGSRDLESAAPEKPALKLG